MFILGKKDAFVPIFRCPDEHRNARHSMLILLDFSHKKIILFDPQRENIFSSLLEVFKNVISDLSGYTFVSEYNMTVSQKFSGDCDWLAYICNRSLHNLVSPNKFVF